MIAGRVVIAREPTSCCAAAHRRARARARRRRAAGVVDVDPVTHTPRVLARLDGTLTGPADGAAATIGLRYVRAHLAALGLEQGDLDTLGAPTVRRARRHPPGALAPGVDGVAAADSELRVNVTADGRVLSVPRLARPRPPAPTPTPDLTAGEAVRAVQDDVGVYRSLTARAGVRRVDLRRRHDRQALALQRAAAWRVTYRAASDAVYDAMVDATAARSCAA